MSLNQLICRAASSYPNARILEYWDMAREQPRKKPDGGDTLAQFIAFELAETFDPEADEGTQIATAVKAMQRASDVLGAIAHALSDLAVERMAA
jgi:hypothetical protein